MRNCGLEEERVQELADKFVQVIEEEREKTPEALRQKLVEMIEEKSEAISDARILQRLIFLVGLIPDVDIIRKHLKID